MAEEGLHRFEPLYEGERIRPGCTCGWRGSPLPADDEGWSDARDEFDVHLVEVGEALEVED